MIDITGIDAALEAAESRRLDPASPFITIQEYADLKGIGVSTAARRLSRLADDIEWGTKRVRFSDGRVGSVRGFRLKPTVHESTR